MPFNVADLPWQAIGLLAGLSFVSSLIGHSLTRNAFAGSIIATILFVAIYLGWNVYPHGYLEGIRFPNQWVPSEPAAPASAPAAPTAPVTPVNPVN